MLDPGRGLDIKLDIGITSGKIAPCRPISRSCAWVGVADEACTQPIPETMLPGATEASANNYPASSGAHTVSGSTRRAIAVAEVLNDQRIEKPVRRK